MKQLFYTLIEPLNIISRKVFVYTKFINQIGIYIYVVRLIEFSSMNFKNTIINSF